MVGRLVTNITPKVLQKGLHDFVDLRSDRVFPRLSLQLRPVSGMGYIIFGQRTTSSKEIVGM